MMVKKLICFSPEQLRWNFKKVTNLFMIVFRNKNKIKI